MTKEIDFESGYVHKRPEPKTEAPTEMSRPLKMGLGSFVDVEDPEWKIGQLQKIAFYLHQMVVNMVTKLDYSSKNEGLSERADGIRRQVFMFQEIIKFINLSNKDYKWVPDKDMDVLGEYKWVPNEE